MWSLPMLQAADSQSRATESWLDRIAGSSTLHRKRRCSEDGWHKSGRGDGRTKTDLGVMVRYGDHVTMVGDTSETD